MALPDVIEIVPWSQAPTARITAPGSKSITNRALILAALASGRTVLRSALWSDDTQVMVGALGRLGIAIEVTPDPGESGNRHLTIAGGGGRIGPGGAHARRRCGAPRGTSGDPATAPAHRARCGWNPRDRQPSRLR